MKYKNFVFIFHLKYKNKYINLKKQSGGGPFVEEKYQYFYLYNGDKKTHKDMISNAYKEGYFIKVHFFSSKKLPLSAPLEGDEKKLPLELFNKASELFKKASDFINKNAYNYYISFSLYDTITHNYDDGYVANDETINKSMKNMDKDFKSHEQHLFDNNEEFKERNSLGVPSNTKKSENRSIRTEKVY